MIRLSAVGMSELRPIRESDLKPFVLPDDDDPIAAVTTTQRPAAGQSLVGSLDRLAKIQCEFTACLMELMEIVIVQSSGGHPVAVAERSTMQTAPVRGFSDLLLSTPWDCITTGELGLPPGCVKVLTEANVITVDALAKCITENRLTQLPKIGKAKAAVIVETFRAFERAEEAFRRKEHEA